MEVKLLKSPVISRIRSSSDISTVAQCVFELVCNSLDAKSTSIAVRLNLLTFKLQVADNGEGITKANMSLVGQRYSTNKCHSLKQLEKDLKTHGYRGESLASIAEMCKLITVSSRHYLSEETYSKTLKEQNQEVLSVKLRPSQGTTVTILGWLSTAPVRQQRIVPEIELEEVKRRLEALVIINPQTSFTLRNDVTGQLVLDSPKRPDILGALRHLHPELSGSFTLLKVSKGKLTVQLLIQKEFGLTKQYQFVYVNKRPVNSPKVLREVGKSFAGRRLKHQVRSYPVFVMNIKCPQACVDLVSRPSRCEVDFTCWDLVLACIEKLGKSFFGPEKEEGKKSIVRVREKVNLGVSQVRGAVEVSAFKRKTSSEKMSLKRKVRRVAGEMPSPDYEFQDSEEVVESQKQGKIKSIMKKPGGVAAWPSENCRPCAEMEFDQKSTYSRLDTNEEQGKGLIMDMFLKSTQVHRGLEKPDISMETIEETNYLFENNVRDCEKGIDTTMSVSVNFKKRRVKDTNVIAPLRDETGHFPSHFCNNKLGSTSFGKLKSLQTELEKSAHKPQIRDDYTILFNAVDHDECVFTGKKKNNVQYSDIMQFQALKLCRYKPGELMFSFKGHLGSAVQASPYFQKKKTISSPCFPDHVQWNMPCWNCQPRGFAHPCSSFPQWSDNLHDHGPLATQFYSEQLEPPMAVRSPSWYNPETQGLSPNICPSEGSKPQQQSDERLNELCDLADFGLVCPDNNPPEGCLVDAKERMEMQQESPSLSDKSRIVVDARNEWLRHFNDHGKKFFLNKRTGMVTAKTPANTQTKFDFAERLDFVPKGFSPVMVERDKVDKTLSQKGKGRLHNMILEGYRDEPMLVKWQNFISDDPKQFFEEIYRDKSRQFERCVPNLKRAHLKTPLEPLNFNNHSFSYFTVIGQLDCKFIVVYDQNRDLLVLFDQHAVHERVLLEKYLREYKGVQAVYKGRLLISLPEHDVGLLWRHRKYIETLGLGLEFFRNGVQVTGVPLCIREKFDVDAINRDVNSLVKNLLDDLKDKRGSTGRVVPRVLQAVISMKACRGAIKFGDVLTEKVCCKLLDELSRCTLPFQCAHGRPTLAPLLSICKVPPFEVKRCSEEVLFNSRFL
ncbi:DNA mismatch repair protein Mlh3-like isoform X2 [Euwallacea fornicatus]|uniref:DNA mismatch repair protein Mlh3-like isoform X2 n=1 Tax=Euwallacea fornicatus TaxID=995702 RepID=UPI00338E4E8A